jgi:hypothetical protein
MGDTVRVEEGSATAIKGAKGLPLTIIYTSQFEYK